MKRRWFTVLGAFEAALPMAIFLAFGLPPLTDSATIFLLTGMLLSGLLLIVGGLDRQIGRIEWFQFVGAGNVIWAGSFMLSQLIPIVAGTSTYDSSAQPVFALLVVVGAGSMLFIGADWMRGGHHFDLSTFERGPIFGSAN